MSWSRRSRIWWAAIAGAALAVAIGLYTSDEPVSASTEPEAEDCVVIQVLPPPKPKPRVKPRPPKFQVLSAGELTAFWSAWDACEGENCID